MLFYLAVWIVSIIALWKVFTKAGQPGWASIIPIYNTYILIKIAERPGWWLLLLLIPFVNLVVAVILTFDIAKRFGKGPAFAIFGLIIFSLIGWLILGYGDAKYTPLGEGGGTAGPAPQTPAAA
jgi:hypothetical protein